ncbi:MAG: DUF4278 domain-containing protein [Leptolyngbyaceae cyanobacterium RM2_2_4]|nr:DUF4278 domain-containing protein [Leptolyngbyaceae cyanobacterium SL_5_14]NJO51682.1 DUF4278 domain-containing protein [Leptolyngbyaceae cyanobacterium RM2_2_4]
MQFSHHFNLFQSILVQGFEVDSTTANKEALGDRLSYRGISYRRPTTSENVLFVSGTYRGSTWRSQPQSWVPDSTMVLRYRGCCYLKQA